MVVSSPFKRMPTRSGYRTYSCTTSKKSNNNIRTHTGQANNFILPPLLYSLFYLLNKPSVKGKREGKKGEKLPLSLPPPPTLLSEISSLLTPKAEGQILGINPPTQRYLTLSAIHSWATSFDTTLAYREGGRRFDFQDLNNTLLKITDEKDIAFALTTRLRIRTGDEPVSSENPK